MLCVCYSHGPKMRQCSIDEYMVNTVLTWYGIIQDEWDLWFCDNMSYNSTTKCKGVRYCENDVFDLIKYQNNIASVSKPRNLAIYTFLGKIVLFFPPRHLPNGLISLILCVLYQYWYIILVYQVINFVIPYSRAMWKIHVDGCWITFCTLFISVFLTAWTNRG